MARFLCALRTKWAIPADLWSDIEPMCLLAIEQTNYLDEGAIEILGPEHPFELTLPGGGIIRGVVDRAAIYQREDGSRFAVISDYKSQGRRFTEADLVNNIQALVYQLFIWKTYSIPASVEFVMLRHPPTKRTLDKHIQRVEPASLDTLEGFEYYLDHMNRVFEGFGLSDAYDHFCDDWGFCRNVCSFYRAFDYWQSTDSITGDLVANYPLDKKPEPCDNQVVTRRTFKGCPKHMGKI